MSSNITLPPGWMQIRDEASGRFYYCNPQTRETRWDPPSGVTTGAPAAATDASFSQHHQQHPPQSFATTSSESASYAHNSQGYQSASSLQGLLIPRVRGVFDQVASLPDQSRDTDLEMTGISVGELSDLCYLQNTNGNAEGEPYYTPINPYTMSMKAKRPQIEQGRLDIRLAELKNKLVQFGGSPPKF